MDHVCCLITGNGLGKKRGGIVRVVVGIVAVVFIKTERAFGTVNDIEHQPVGSLRDVHHRRGIIGYDGSLSEEIGYLGIGKCHAALAGSLYQLVGRHAPPLALGEPYLFLCKSVCLRPCCYRCNKDVVSEHILSFVFIGLVGFGIVVVERTAERYARIVGFACHGVEIWEQRIAQAHGIEDGREVREFPYTTLYA